MASERTSYWPILDQTGGWEKRGKQKKKKEIEKESLRERERLHLLSKFLGNRTSGFKWSKRKSLSSRKRLRIENGIKEFRQTPRVRSSPTLVSFYPKGCVVVVLP